MKLKEFMPSLGTAIADSLQWKAEIENLEDRRKTILAQQKKLSLEKSDSAREDDARSSDEYIAISEQIAEARRRYAAAAAQAQYLNARWESWRTVQASVRARINQR